MDGESDTQGDDPRKVRPAGGLPSRAEINEFECLDGDCAEAIFFGKTLDEAEKIIREAAPAIFEDLMWMGPVGFAYYVDAAIRYLESPAADEDSDSVYGFLTTVEYRLRHDKERIDAECWGRVAAALDSLLADFARFDVDPEIYGDVPGRITALRGSIDAAGDVQA